MVKGIKNGLRTFYIGGLPLEVDSNRLTTSLVTYLSRWGDVVYIDIQKVVRGTGHTNLSKGYGFFMYRTDKQADNFMKCRPHEFQNREISLKRGVCKGTYGTPGILDPIKTVFFAGLRFITTEIDLREAFKQNEEEIVNLEIIKDKDTGKATGYGFITFTDEDTVDKLVSTNHLFQVGRGKCLVKKKLSERELKKLKADSEMEVIENCIKRSKAEREKLEFSIDNSEEHYRIFDPVKTVFIAGLYDGKTVGDLIESFKEDEEKIENLGVIKDKYTGKANGFGFITFTDKDYVDKLFQTTDYIEVKGSKRMVKKKLPNEELEKFKSEVKLEQNHKTIFIAGLGAETTVADLRKTFRRDEKKIENLGIIKDRNTGKAVGIGFVTFTDEDYVDKLVLTTAFIEINRYKCTVKKNLSKEELEKFKPDRETKVFENCIKKSEVKLQENLNTVFITGLDDGTSVDDLRESFKQDEEKIENLGIIKDKDTGNATGYGLITLTDEESVDKLVLTTANIEIKRCKCIVKKKLSKEDLEKLKADSEMEVIENCIKKSEDNLEKHEFNSDDSEEHDVILDPMKTVFIVGLEDGTTVGDLIDSFEEDKENIENLGIMKVTDEGIRFGFITFTDEDYIEKLVLTTDFIDVKGSICTLKRKLSKEEVEKLKADVEVDMEVIENCTTKSKVRLERLEESLKTIFIVGLEDGTSIEDLRESFKQDEEKIENLGIIKDKDTGEATGFGFITVAEKDCVDKIVLKTDFIEIKESICVVKKNLSKEELEKLKADSEMNVIEDYIKKSEPIIEVETPEEFNFHNFNLGITTVEPKIEIIDNISDDREQEDVSEQAHCSCSSVSEVKVETKVKVDEPKVKPCDPKAKQGNDSTQAKTSGPLVKVCQPTSQPITKKQVQSSSSSGPLVKFHQPILHPNQSGSGNHGASYWESNLNQFGRRFEGYGRNLFGLQTKIKLDETKVKLDKREVKPCGQGNVPTKAQTSGPLVKHCQPTAQPITKKQVLSSSLSGSLVKHCQPTAQPATNEQAQSSSSSGPLVKFHQPVLHPKQSGSGSHGGSYWGSNLNRFGRRYEGYGRNVFGPQWESKNAPGFDGYGSRGYGYSVDNVCDGRGQLYDENNNDIYGRDYGHEWYGNYDGHGQDYVRAGGYNDYRVGSGQGNRRFQVGNQGCHGFAGRGQDYVRDTYNYDGKSYVGGVSGRYCNKYSGYGYVRPRYGAGRYFDGYAGQGMRGASTSSSWQSRQSNSGQVCNNFTSKPQVKPIEPRVTVRPIKPVVVKFDISKVQSKVSEPHIKLGDGKVKGHELAVKVHQPEVSFSFMMPKDESKVKFNGCKVGDDSSNTGQIQSDAWPGTSHSSCSSVHKIKPILPNVNLHGVLAKSGDLRAKVNESKVKFTGCKVAPGDDFKNNGQSHSDAWPQSSHSSCASLHEIKPIQSNVNVHGVLAKFDNLNAKVHESRVKVHESKVKVHKPKVKVGSHGQFHDDDRTTVVCKIFPKPKVKVGQPTDSLGDPNVKVGDCGQGRSEDGPRQAQSNSWSELVCRTVSGTLLKFHSFEPKVNPSDLGVTGRKQVNTEDGTKRMQSSRFTKLDGQKVKVVETKETTVKKTVLKFHGSKNRLFEPKVSNGPTGHEQVNTGDRTRGTQSDRFTKRKVKLEVDGFGQGCSGEPEAKRKVKFETRNIDNDGFPVCGRNYGGDCKMKNRNQPTKRFFEPKVKVKTEVDDGFHGFYGFEQDCGTSGSRQSNNSCSSNQTVKVKTEVNDEFVGFGPFCGGDGTVDASNSGSSERRVKLEMIVCHVSEVSAEAAGTSSYGPIKSEHYKKRPAGPYGTGYSSGGVGH